MVRTSRLLSSITIGGWMSKQMWDDSCKYLAKVIAKSRSDKITKSVYELTDYSDVVEFFAEEDFIILNPVIDECTQQADFTGNPVGFINWLRLADILILRPYGAYIKEQVINIATEADGNKEDTYVVQLFGMDGDLKNVTYEFLNGTMTIRKSINIIPKEMWMKIVSIVAGKQLTCDGIDTHKYLQFTEGTTPYKTYNITGHDASHVPIITFTHKDDLEMWEYMNKKVIRRITKRCVMLPT